MDEFTLIHNSITESARRIPRHVAKIVGSFAVFRADGDEPPLFWCFNDWAEAIFLAHWLGPRQPLIAMRSMHGIVASEAKKKGFALRLATRYLDEMASFVGDKPVLLGGNCQAGPIAEAMAHLLIARLGRHPLLILLEHQPTYCYPGHVIMLFGSRSEKYNPFLKGEDPVPAWQRQHRAPAWGVLDGEHGRYFIEPTVHELVACLKDAASQFVSTGQYSTGEIDVLSNRLRFGSAVSQSR